MIQKLLLPFFLLVFTDLSAQNWQLDSISSTMRYSFCYSIELYSEDTSSHRLEPFISKDPGTFRIINNKYEPIPGLETCIFLVTDGKQITILTTMESDGDLQLQPGHYIIQVKGNNGYETHSASFTLKAGQQISATVVLGSTKSTRSFGMYSKKELTEKKLNKIRFCIEQHPRDFTSCNSRRYVLYNF